MMKLFIKSILPLAFAVSVAVMGGEGTTKYPQYQAAQEALSAGECDRATEHLRIYLQNHPYIRTKHTDHYREVRYIMNQCTNKISVRGIGDEEDVLPTLPDQPPMEREP